jgi:hypothetical protein
MSRPWNEDSEACRMVFTAALTGILANPNFFGSLFQQSPRAAVEFADQVVREAFYDPEPSK